MSRIIAQAREEYLEARRKGNIRYSLEIGRGRTGHLPVLEDILTHAPIALEQYVGIEEVPLHKIIGTATHSRARSFGPDFLPLEHPGSEFAHKWTAVYAHQLEEGIREPVELREYLNWYWVVEGNKRISVLAYLGAASIEGRVTRLVPKKNSKDPAVSVYFRFLDFKKRTGLSNLWVRIPGGYDRLLSLIDAEVRPPGPKENRYLYFRSKVYLPFRTLFKEEGGDRLPLTTAEAFLRFCEIAGFPSSMTGPEDRRKIAEVIKELSVDSGDLGISTGALKQTSTPLRRSISRLFRAGRPLRVVFVHYGSPSVSLWTRYHETARLALEKEMRPEVATRAFWVDGDPETFRNTIRRAVEHADLLFATAAVLFEETRKAAMEHPEVRFYIASRHRSGVHFRTYSPRTHEAHYLAGIIAGALCGSSPVGFMVSDSSSYTFASVNAFALGARGVNRQARIRVIRGSRPPEPPAPGGGEQLYHNMLATAGTGTPGYGLYGTDGSRVRRLAELTYDWREFYRDLVENILAGSYRDFESDTGDRARLLTYWGGIRNGIVDLRISADQVPGEVRRIAEGMKTLLQLGEFNPFGGPLKDRGGKTRLAEGEFLDYDGIISMDYFLEGVEGEEPDRERLLTP